ncbi:alpha/beta fold hydrolase [Pokkaliibacter sp. CJK22405]|uniref:alpha/beta fold hydrolase n=1 Tax=Pokkaliibacter sp. CJK22405 TaxID=3384615 RepID=UPI00398537B2
MAPSSRFSVKVRSLALPDVKVTYRLYSRDDIAPSAKLLLLHGAGVAGELTWDAIIEHLEHWGEILVPDLRGMGDTVNLSGDEEAFSVIDVMGDVLALVDQLGWWQFDLAGYSFGGLVAMLLKNRHPSRVGKMFLLEPALLDRQNLEDVKEVRRQFSRAAAYIREASSPEEGIRLFLDTISPQRSRAPQIEAVTMQRLGERPYGFANALDAVTHAAHQLDRDELIASLNDVLLMAGGKSVDALHQHYQRLAHQRDDLHYHEVPGTDHSLPYQKPRHIGRAMNSHKVGGE